MRTAWTTATTALGLAACVPMYVQNGGATSMAQPESFNNLRYKVTIVAASIAETRADGQAWHTKEPDASIPVMTALASLSMGPVAGQLASAVLKDTEAGKAIPPSPIVKVQVGGSVFQTIARRAKFQPQWDYSFAVDIRDFAQQSDVVMVVVDDDGDAPIEQFRMTLGELLSRPDHNLQVGQVQALQIKVQPLADRPSYREVRFRVPGNEFFENLAQLPGPRFDGDWQAVEVLNGDIVRVKATGWVVPGEFTCTTAAGPEGYTNGDCMSYNLREFHDMAHASLVGFVAGRPVAVGSERVIEVPTAGRLLLGVNDGTADNNNGAFDVVVEVNPPDLVRDRPAGPAFQAPTWEQPPPQAPQPQTSPSAGAGTPQQSAAP